MAERVLGRRGKERFWGGKQVVRLMLGEGPQGSTAKSRPHLNAFSRVDGPVRGELPCWCWGRCLNGSVDSLDSSEELQVVVERARLLAGMAGMGWDGLAGMMGWLG